jgi:hypothetical protein
MINVWEAPEIKKFIIPKFTCINILLTKASGYGQNSN